MSQAQHSHKNEAMVGVVLDSMINMQAQMIAYIDCFKIMMMIVIASIPLVFFLKNTGNIVKAQISE